MSESAQKMWFSQTIHTYKPYWLSWAVIFECHDILMSIKWRQRPDMIIAVDWDVKHQFKKKKNPEGIDDKHKGNFSLYFKFSGRGLHQESN